MGGCEEEIQSGKNLFLIDGCLTHWAINKKEEIVKEIQQDECFLQWPLVRTEREMAIGILHLDLFSPCLTVFFSSSCYPYGCETRTGKTKNGTKDRITFWFSCPVLWFVFLVL